MEDKLSQKIETLQRKIFKRIASGTIVYNKDLKSLTALKNESIKLEEYEATAVLHNEILKITNEQSI